MAIFVKLDRRYILETKVSKEHILASLRYLMGAEKEKNSSLSFFNFNYSNYNSISMHDDKVTIDEIRVDKTQLSTVGSIDIKLENTVNGTIIIAELKPHRDQIKITSICLLTSIPAIFFAKSFLTLSANESLILAISWSVFVPVFIFLSIIYIKKTLKNYLFNLFRAIGLENTFTSIQ